MPAATQVSLTPVMPMDPSSAADSDANTVMDAAMLGEDPAAGMRMNLSSPPDEANELIKVAALHGPPGILAVLRAKREYSWLVVLGFRAIEVCLAPRDAIKDLRCLEGCDPVEFAMRMMEMEMIDEIFMLMKRFEHVKGLQQRGLAILELLIMDDLDWRDEVVRKGGARLLCDIAKQRRDSPNIMCQVMTCVSYLAAEDYIEIMLCQYDALEYVTHILQYYSKNAELVTRTSLALLNLTVCEAHVEELNAKQAVPLVLRALEHHKKDLHVVIIMCGVLANLSVSDEVRELLVAEGLFPVIRDAIRLDANSAVLQVACLKAVVNYSQFKSHYNAMEELGIPTLVTDAMVRHSEDAGVTKYGDYFFQGTPGSGCVIS